MNKMKNLLEKDFPVYYGVHRPIAVTIESKTGDFSLNDSKACAACKGMTTCNPPQEVEKFIHSGEAFVIHYEEYISQYNGTKVDVEERCDYLIYDEQQKNFIINELTCSQEKYINPYINSQGQQIGKRAKAQIQMTKSIERLKNVPTICSAIDKYEKKIALFACRIRQVNIGDAAINSMNTFLSSLKIVSHIEGASLPGNFVFEQLIYDEVYDLDII